MQFDPWVLPLLAIGAGFLAQVVASCLVYLEVYDECPNDYLWVIAREKWEILLIACFAGVVTRSSICGLFFFLGTRIWNSSDQLSFHGIAIFLAVFVALMKLCRKVDCALVNRFTSAVGPLLEKEYFSYINSEGWWDAGLSDKEKERRINVLYEDRNFYIANEHRRPELLCGDLGVHLQQKFCLLAKHLGRKKFREEIINVPSASARIGWNGSERRWKRGTLKDRAEPDSNPIRYRKYDSPELLKQISLGIACGSPLHTPLS